MLPSNVSGETGAAQSRDGRRKLLGDEPLPAPTPHAATTYAALEAEIQALASRGYALARQSTFIGIYAVAAPIRGPHGFIGCLAFTGSVHGVIGNPILPSRRNRIFPTHS